VLGEYKGKEIIGFKTSARKHSEKLNSLVAERLRTYTNYGQQISYEKSELEKQQDLKTDVQLKEQLKDLDKQLGRFAIVGTERLEQQIDKGKIKAYEKEIPVEERLEKLKAEHEKVMSLERRISLSKSEFKKSEEQLIKVEKRINERQKAIKVNSDKLFDQGDIFHKYMKEGNYDLAIKELDRKNKEKKAGMFSKYSEKQKDTMISMRRNLEDLKRFAKGRKGFVAQNVRSKGQEEKLQKQLQSMELVYKDSAERSKVIEAIEIKIGGVDKGLDLGKNI
jgi:tetratricopeptide (TPR) repeat protein